jgi:histidyl-tRNA synthetase
MYQSISGFPEFSPAEQIVWNKTIDIIRKNYELVGAVPIETAAVERVETLRGKSSNDKEVYALRRLAAEGQEGVDGNVNLALRFDLTVPMARYVGEHSNDLTFPFRRYQMQPVWRGERAQKGRYRQFQQCDIDVIGDGALALLNDAEMPVVIYKIFKELNIGHFVISINNRKILTGFLETIGFKEKNVGYAIKIVDNIEKVGLEETRKELGLLGANDSTVDKLIEFFSISGNTDQVIEILKNYEGNDEFQKGVNELEEVVEFMRILGLPEDFFKINLSIARGLDYYTGTVYETRLSSHPKIGSICSGGRYDELLEKLGANRKMPGVGISIGLSRVFPSLIEAGIIKIGSPTVADVLITTMDSSKMGKYLTYGSSLRESKINTEVYSEPKKLGKQMKYANKKGYKVVVIAGGNEFDEGNVIIRNLADGEETTVKESLMIETIKNILN